MTDARLHQQSVETLVTGQTSDARLSQQNIEALVTGQTSDARLIQQSVEVLLVIDYNVTVSGPSADATASGDAVAIIGNAIIAATGATATASGDPVTPVFPFSNTVTADSASATASGDAVVLDPETRVAASAATATASGDVVQIPQFISVSSITSTETFGATTVIAPDSPQTLYPASIVSSEQVGLHRIRMIVGPAGIPSEEAFGTPILPMIVVPSIFSEEIFGVPTLNPGPTIVNANAGPPGETFGVPRLIGYAVGVDPVHVRHPNRLRDPRAGADYDWVINHSTEDAATLRRNSELGASNPEVSLVRILSPSGHLALRWQGAAITDEHHDALEDFYDACEDVQLTLTDWLNDAYLVVISSLDMHKVAGRSQLAPARAYYWRYTIEFTVIEILSAAQVTVGVKA